MTVTIITMVTIIVYLYKACIKMTLFIEDIYLIVQCTVYMFLSP